MPNDPWAIAIAMAMLAFFLGLTSKVFFDWIKLRGKASHYVSPHLICEQRVQACKESFELVRKDITKVDSCIAAEKLKTAAIVQQMDEHEKRLDRGREDFRELKHDITDIKANVATLLERSQRTRENYPKGDDLK